MERLTEDIASGRFADEWDAESRAGHPRLTALREQFAGPAIAALERSMRDRLGPRVK
jgi:ketol-acid reductoisomerase